jgi:hypothetical protein
MSTTVATTTQQPEFKSINISAGLIAIFLVEILGLGCMGAYLLFQSVMGAR